MASDSGLNAGSRVIRSAGQVSLQKFPGNEHPHPLPSPSPPHGKIELVRGLLETARSGSRQCRAGNKACCECVVNLLAIGTLTHCLTTTCGCL